MKSFSWSMLGSDVVWEGSLVKKTYPNGRVALIHQGKDGSMITKVTTNIPEIELADGEVIIKNYSENEGILEALIGQGVVSQPIRFIKSGFISFPIVKLLI